MANVQKKNRTNFLHQTPILIGLLKVGALSGGAAGILRSSTPGLFALASGAQWALLGSTYYGSREVILQTWQVTPSSPPQDRIYPSTLAGAVTGGTIGGLLRGRTNIIPGAIMFSLFGFAGQHVYNRLDARHAASLVTQSSPNATDDPSKTTSDRPLWTRILNSKYSPMKVLSDEQYQDILKEKLIRVDAEIALVDDEIEKVKEKVRDQKEVD
ncbi:MAG: hypothetical protein Q9219_007235 [cf. Caloplaca sp. 3 TL-2023]